MLFSFCRPLYLRHFTLEKAKATGVINGGIISGIYLLTCATAEGAWTGAAGGSYVGTSAGTLAGQYIGSTIGTMICPGLGSVAGYLAGGAIGAVTGKIVGTGVV
ncbi:hypothetical protein [Streptococcus mutans]|uniref:hypothetical protein n=1 Tax=Streptococcus mutans TaxID=1309 RepID=UPI0002B54338|nr:hypothetical protein [Streptococcus mutans]EMB67278.1 hypothetical protein SMU33_09851 [Streptococcus mutans 11SSST2]